jgi:hypothetical protein
MKIKVIQLLLSIGLLIPCLFSSVKGQFVKSYIVEVNFYTSRIDSLATQHDFSEIRRNIDLEMTLAEGTISQQTTKVIYNGTKGKNDTIVKSEIIGGFSKKTLTIGDTILRILYHDNVDKNIYETFYFKNNQLICSKVRLEDNGIGNVLYNGIEYYRAGILMYTKSPPTKAKKKYRARIAFSWWQTGTESYQEFRRQQN